MRTLIAPAPPEDVDEIAELHSRVYWSWFSGRIVINPTFGVASTLLGGADGDLVAGPTLLDVKVTREHRPSKAHWRQVVAYAVLANRFGIDGAGPAPIDAVGLYMARSAAIYALPLEELVPRRQWDALIDHLIADRARRARLALGVPHGQCHAPAPVPTPAVSRPWTKPPHGWSHPGGA